MQHLPRKKLDPQTSALIARHIKRHGVTRIATGLRALQPGDIQRAIQTGRKARGRAPC